MSAPDGGAGPAPGPEDEEYVWQLHRELNGLRGSRGRAAAKQQQKQQQQARASGGAATTQPPPRRVVVVTTTTSNSSSPGSGSSSSSSSSDDDDAGAEKQQQKKNAGQDKPSGKRPAASAAAAAAATATGGAAAPPPSNKRRKNQQQQQLALVPAAAPPTTGTTTTTAEDNNAENDGENAARAASRRGRVLAAHAALEPHLRPLNPLDDKPPTRARLTAPAYAAAVAAHVIRRKARRACARLAAARVVRDNLPLPETQEAARAVLLQRPHEVKVFVAGVRWGCALPSACLDSRRSLARSLADAMQGEVPSFGRGDTLSVVFVDGAGRATELPPTRGVGGGGRGGGGAAAAAMDGAADGAGSDGGDGDGTNTTTKKKKGRAAPDRASREAWRRAAATAARVYVRDVAFVASLVDGAEAARKAQKTSGGGAG